MARCPFQTNLSPPPFSTNQKPPFRFRFALERSQPHVHCDSLGLDGRSPFRLELDKVSRLVIGRVGERRGLASRTEMCACSLDSPVLSQI